MNIFTGEGGGGVTSEFYRRMRGLCALPTDSAHCRPTLRPTNSAHYQPILRIIDRLCALPNDSTHYRPTLRITGRLGALSTNSVDYRPMLFGKFSIFILIPEKVVTFRLISLVRCLPSYHTRNIDSNGINFFAQDLSSSDPMLSDPLHYCWLGPCSVSFAVIAGHARLLYVCYTTVCE